MQQARPTTIKQFTENCGHSLDHYERGTVYDRERFGVGAAGHEALYALAVGMDVGKLATVLMRDGKQGPDTDAAMDPTHVAQGFMLAQRYADRNGFPENGEYERRFAFTESWESMEWSETDDNPPDDSAYYTRLDIIEQNEIEDDDFGGIEIVVTDYKGHAAGTSALYTIQRMFQAVVAWKAFPDAVSIVLRVASYQHVQAVERTIYPQSDFGKQELGRYQSMIESYREAMKPPDDGSDRPASPGPKCHGCFYVRRCKYAIDYINNGDDLLKRWVLVEALRADLMPEVKKAVKDHPQEVDGFLIGKIPGTERKARHGATAEAMVKAMWAHTDVPVGVKLALTNLLDNTTRNGPKVESLSVINQLAKKLYPDRNMKDARTQWVEEFVETIDVQKMKTVRIPTDDGVEIESTETEHPREPVQLEDWLPSS